MLKIAIEEIPEGVSVLEYKIKPEEVGLEAEDAHFIEPITIELNLFRQVDKIFVKFRSIVVVELECVRCLDTVQATLESASVVQYRPLPKIAKHGLDDIGIGYYSGEYIDITDEIRESLLLELPMSVLCSEDCKGLCPHCGQNLNVERCNCLELEEVRVSRFAELVKSLEIRGKLEV